LSNHLGDLVYSVHLAINKEEKMDKLQRNFEKEIKKLMNLGSKGPI